MISLAPFAASSVHVTPPDIVVYSGVPCGIAIPTATLR
jgi:hypothetical protein